VKFLLKEKFIYFSFSTKVAHGRKVKVEAKLQFYVVPVELMKQKYSCFRIYLQKKKKKKKIYYF
jgi:hypothetical protein